MSDDEYDFHYSDDDAPMDADVDEDDVGVRIQNEYYTAKGMIDTDVPGALAGLERVCQLCDTLHNGASSSVGVDPYEWTFKARKRALKTRIRTFAASGGADDVLAMYDQVLEMITAGRVSKNRGEKAVGSVLDLVAAHLPGEALTRMYEETLRALGASGGNERLVFKTQLKLARQLLSAGRLSECASVCASLSRASMDGSGRLEVAALQIQVFTAQKDTKRATEVYAMARGITAAVSHPGITGVIREAGGKIAAEEGEWERARVEFLEAFKAYSEAGSGDRTIACLQYMLLANMLATSHINPFDSQETKAFERDPRVSAMVSLTDAYMCVDMHTFGAAMRSKEAAAIKSDPFMGAYIGDLENTMRRLVLLELVRPYTRLRTSSLAQTLTLTHTAVETLVAGLVTDGLLAASIDQIAGTITLHAPPQRAAWGQLAAASPTASPTSTHTLTTRQAAAHTRAAKFTQVHAACDRVAALTDKLASAVARLAVPRDRSVFADLDM